MTRGFRRVAVLAALAPALAAASPLPAGDPPPAKPVPLDADLDPEREILREARSDPRNLKPDAFPVIRMPAYSPASEARRMDPEEWVIGVVIGGTALAFPVNVLNQHEILEDEAGGVPFLVCW
jgi:hypothetical protein